MAFEETTIAASTWYNCSTDASSTDEWGSVTISSYPSFMGQDDYLNDKINDLKEEIKKLKKHLKKKEKNMKTLYEITVVDLDGKIIIGNQKVVGSDKEEALFESDVSAIIKQNGLSIKEVTIIARELGQVKTRPEKKRVIVEKE
jgi:hypothetical protein